MQDDGKINLDKSAQEKYKSSTTLNKKNIIKAIAVIIAGIIGISLFFNFLFSNPKDEEKKRRWKYFGRKSYQWWFKKTRL